jgi:hypothetical protein
MKWSVTKFPRNILIVFLLLPAWGAVAHGQEFEKWKAKTAEYKNWLDSIKLDGHRFWTKLDSTQRPHKLYVGEGFFKADYTTKEHFVEAFSHYLAGHPGKFMLIDIFDSTTGKPIGEFGWGGFKLYQPSLAVRNREEHPK